MPHKLHLKLSYTAESLLFNTNCGLLEIDARLIGIGPSEPRGLEIAKLRLNHLQVGRAQRTGLSVFELFDLADDTYELHEFIFQESEYELRAPIARLFPKLKPTDDLMIVNGTEFLPGTEKMGLEAAVLHQVAEDWGPGVGLILTYPSAWPCAKAKLLSHLKALGFRDMGHDWWGLAPSELKDKEKLNLPYELAVDALPARA